MAPKNFKIKMKIKKKKPKRWGKAAGIPATVISKDRLVPSEEILQETSTRQENNLNYTALDNLTWSVKISPVQFFTN